MGQRVRFKPADWVHWLFTLSNGLSTTSFKHHFLLIQNLKKGDLGVMLLAHSYIIYNIVFFWNIPLDTVSQILRSRNYLSYLLPLLYLSPGLSTSVFSILFGTCCCFKIINRKYLINLISRTWKYFT